MTRSLPNGVPAARWRRVLLSLGLAVLVGGAGTASAQSEYDDWTGSESLRNQDDAREWKTRAWTGFEYQGKTDLDSPGDFEYWMVSGGADIARPLSDQLKIVIQGDYRAIGYDFGGIRRAGTRVDPWETVHVARLAPIFSYSFNDTWSILGGPVAEFSGEDKAKLGDSLRGGGALGIGYTGRRLYLAFGILALTEIEKDARIQPLILIRYNITDELTFGLKSNTSRGGEFRLDYIFEDQLSIGIGLGARRELFRLNGDQGNLPGPPPFGRRDGVGEEEAVVAQITLGYKFNSRFTIEGHGGITMDGQFRLENEHGRKIASSDYDDSGFGGVNVAIAF